MLLRFGLSVSSSYRTRSMASFSSSRAAHLLGGCRSGCGRARRSAPSSRKSAAAPGTRALAVRALDAVRTRVANGVELRAQVGLVEVPARDEARRGRFRHASRSARPGVARVGQGADQLECTRLSRDLDGFVDVAEGLLRRWRPWATCASVARTCARSGPLGPATSRASRKMPSASAKLPARVSAVPSLRAKIKTARSGSSSSPRATSRRAISSPRRSASMSVFDVSRVRSPDRRPARGAAAPGRNPGRRRRGGPELRWARRASRRRERLWRGARGAPRRECPHDQLAEERVRHRLELAILYSPARRS